MTNACLQSLCLYGTNGKLYNHINCHKYNKDGHCTDNCPDNYPSTQYEDERYLIETVTSTNSEIIPSTCTDTVLITSIDSHQYTDQDIFSTDEHGSDDKSFSWTFTFLYNIKPMTIMMIPPY